MVILMVTNVNRKKNNRDLGLSRVLLYHGVIARVAKRLGISRGFVSRVANNLATSNRVTNALRTELDRIDANFLGGRHG